MVLLGFGIADTKVSVCVWGLILSMDDPYFLYVNPVLVKPTWNCLDNKLTVLHNWTSLVVNCRLGKWPVGTVASRNACVCGRSCVCPSLCLWMKNREHLKWCIEDLLPKNTWCLAGQGILKGWFSEHMVHTGKSRTWECSQAFHC